MTRPAAYDILFEPVKIGPLTARNRFYQVPHCNGMGYRDPTALAEMRGVKAEGGWAVVCTEQVELHYSSDITPFIELRLWDDRDIPALARMSEKIHEHGALAGLELAYNGMNGPNLYSREVPMGPAHLPVATFSYDPVQALSLIHIFYRPHGGDGGGRAGERDRPAAAAGTGPCPARPRGGVGGGGAEIGDRDWRCAGAGHHRRRRVWRPPLCRGTGRHA